MIDLNTLTAKGLVTVDGASRRLGPISSLIGWVADRVLPDVTATAGGCPTSGYHLCRTHSCKLVASDPCHWLNVLFDKPSQQRKIYYMVRKDQDHCSSGVYSCEAWGHCC